MNVEKEALWDVITDYESYPDFTPGTESCKILERKGNTVLCEYNLSMMMKKVRYVLKHVEKPMKSLKWSMESGELFKSNDGGWDIKELAPGKLEVTYTVSVGFPLFVPKAIVNSLVGTTLPAMLTEFEKQAKARAKKGLKKPAAQAKPQKPKK
jgi:coenzyme Q-binding protein COQ10